MVPAGHEPCPVIPESRGDVQLRIIIMANGNAEVNLPATNGHNDRATADRRHNPVGFMVLAGFNQNPRG